MNKKILIVTNHYLPGYKAGGPIKSISSICENLKNDFDITVMTSNHDFGDTELYSDIKFDEVVKLKKYDAVYLSKITLKSVKKQILYLSPDIIYLNSFFSKFTFFVLLLKKLRLVNTKIILAPRGELSQGALSLKAKKKSFFIKIAKILNLYSKDLIFHATDKIEKDDIKKLFYKNEIVEIPNLTIVPNIQSKGIVKNKWELKIIFLSRISAKKNLLYALEILKEIDSENIVFDIYGTKEDIKYWDKCEKLINSLKYVQVNYKGSVKPIDIHNIMSQYHLFFLPTKNENFGHAIVEAMQIGVIPLISDQTPWNDLEKYEAGWSLALDDRNSFIERIKEIRDYTQEEFNIKSENVLNYIDNKLDNRKFIEEYKKLFNKGNQ